MKHQLAICIKNIVFLWGKILFILLSFFIFFSVYGQGIKVCCTEHIHKDIRNYNANEPVVDFNIGDSLIVFGFTKQSEGSYDFALYNDTCAFMLTKNTIPFNITEKELKKQLSKVEKVQSILVMKKQNAEYEKAERKQRAHDSFVERRSTTVRSEVLNGKIYFISNGALYWRDTFPKGDTIRIAGRDSEHNALFIYNLHFAKEYYLTKDPLEVKTLLPDSVIDFLPDYTLDAEMQSFRQKLITDTKERRRQWEEDREIALQNKFKAERLEKERQEKYFNDSLDSVYKSGEYLTIVDAYVTHDSRGRVTPYIYYHNNSKKAIKYVYFTIKFKNNVGDFVDNELMQSTRGQYSQKLKDTGPIDPYKRTTGSSWDIGFYNYTATKIYFSSIQIIYMDNTKVNMNVKLANDRVANNIAINR